MNRLDPLLPLKEAARLLNVHPATLRRWADNGDIVAVLTPGGHRRFPRSEIERMAAPAVSESSASKTLEQSALTHTRAEIVEHRSESWMDALDDEARAQQRQLGRHVMGLMMRYIAETDDSEELLSEARSIGHTYASMSRQAGLSLSQTMQAMMFFRENIVESVVLLPDSVRARIDNSKALLRRVNTFLNAVLLGITESFDAG